MELYLNEIYLGRGTYGVAAAALAYFDKSLAELEPHEMAFLAALPKAPNRYEPTRNYQAALDRRNWAIGRMMKEGYIDQKLHDAARARALQTKAPGRRELVQAPYFVEQVRIEIEQILGDQVLHDGGLYVRTSLDPILQAHATQALRQGLLRYDRRHGWRGPLAKLATDESNGPQRQAIETWLEQFASFKKPAGALDHWHLALVTAATTEHATIRLQNSRTGTIKTEDLAWARLHDPKRNRTTGAEITAATEVLTPGDLILVEALPIDLTGDRSNLFALRQIPNINGGLIAIDPHTGRILAMVGGWRYQQSQFNRAVQALRQPGSAFKPFVYLAALEQGYTPATLILDAPFVFDQGPGLKRWKPSNYTRKFYGPSPMHIGIEQSRNLMTVRLANTIGIDKIIDMAALFRIQDPMPPLLSMALGAGETSLLRLTSAYAMIVNGGKQIQPTFMDRVQDRTGKTIYQTDLRICPSCNAPRWQAQTAPELPDPRKPLVDPVHAYQIVTMLEGV
ncbi:MAG: penicillin-binding transpeptidase domain-containing protein, partial [Pseudomonadota bacterium]